MAEKKLKVYGSELEIKTTGKGEVLTQELFEGLSFTNQCIAKSYEVYVGEKPTIAKYNDSLYVERVCIEELFKTLGVL